MNELDKKITFIEKALEKLNNKIINYKLEINSLQQKIKNYEIIIENKKNTIEKKTEDKIIKNEKLKNNFISNDQAQKIIQDLIERVKKCERLINS